MTCITVVQTVHCFDLQSLIGERPISVAVLPITPMGALLRFDGIPLVVVYTDRM